jgi:NADH-quinone oxidoreductase subunit N
MRFSIIIDNKQIKSWFTNAITLQICNFTFFLFLGLLLNIGTINSFVFSDLNFLFNSLSSGSKVFIVFFSMISIFLCFDHILETKINLFEYVFLKMLAVLSLCFLVMVNDLLGMYIVIEILSLCLYILAGFKRNSAFSTEAGMKYFVLGCCASCFLLLGIAFVYAYVGSTNLQDIKCLIISLDESKKLFDMVNIGLILMGCAFLFKLAIFPFHM